MVVQLPCTRVKMLVNCDHMGLCLLSQYYQDAIWNIQELINELAKLVVDNHIHKYNCSICMQDLKIIYIQAYYS
ncbi:M2-2 protein [Gull metapneumovirus]|nr:M2-2 protein [Gull metapneumovirus]